MGRSHDQTGSDLSRDLPRDLPHDLPRDLSRDLPRDLPHDLPRDQSRDQVPKPASNQSCDKEREHDLMHAYFCRRNLCYVHNRY